MSGLNQSAIVDFLSGAAPDHAGRNISEIWGWNHRKLEMVHDYIQWLFPLTEPSRFNPNAPLLTAADIVAIRSAPTLQTQIRRSLDLMLDFLGLERHADRITRAPDYAQRSAHWLAPANHNHLRLTRIILFLRHAGLERESRQLFKCLEEIAAHEGRGIIAEQTLGFWRSAAPPS